MLIGFCTGQLSRWWRLVACHPLDNHFLNVPRTKCWRKQVNNFFLILHGLVSTTCLLLKLTFSRSPKFSLTSLKNLHHWPSSSIGCPLWLSLLWLFLHYLFPYHFLPAQECKQTPKLSLHPQLLPLSTFFIGHLISFPGLWPSCLCRWSSLWGCLFSWACLFPTVCSPPATSHRACLKQNPAFFPTTNEFSFELFPSFFPSRF